MKTTLLILAGSVALATGIVASRLLLLWLGVPQ